MHVALVKDGAVERAWVTWWSVSHSKRHSAHSPVHYNDKYVCRSTWVCWCRQHGRLQYAAPVVGDLWVSEALCPPGVGPSRQAGDFVHTWVRPHIKRSLPPYIGKSSSPAMFCHCAVLLMLYTEHSTLFDDRWLTAVLVVCTCTCSASVATACLSLFLCQLSSADTFSAITSHYLLTWRRKQTIALVPFMELHLHLYSIAIC